MSATTALASTARFRFAPTPSRELHVGNALAALIGWAMARRARGTFVLRVEDIDRARCKPAFEAAIAEDLAWLGLDWDEGPDVGGAFGPYRQSERLGDYDALMRRLAAAGLAYPCVCSRADIRAAQSAPHLAAGDELPYPGTCRGRVVAGALASDASSGSGGYRLDLDALAAKVGVGPYVAWRDGLVGAREEDVRATSGDVLLGRPGQPTYQLAVVADDRAMRVSDVVRGIDLIGSTARQILVRAALDAVLEPAPSPPPRHHHHPLLVGDDGKKLSKRDAASPLATLRRLGTDPARLGAALGRAIGLFAPHVARAAPADWIDALATGPALHDGMWRAGDEHGAAPRDAAGVV